MQPSGPDDLERRIVVRVARISTARAKGESSLDNYLTARDRERAAQFRFIEDRMRLVVGRWILGRCLSRFWGFPNAALDLEYSLQGRPSLAGHPDVEFSISHTGDLVGVALATNSAVGIDLERTDRKVDREAVAKRIMGAEDLKRFEQLSEEKKTQSFYQIWTAKEAWLKAQGVGISGNLKEATVPLHSSFSRQGLPPLEASVGETPKGSWSIQALALPDGYVGNVVWGNNEKSIDFAWMDSSDS